MTPPRFFRALAAALLLTGSLLALTPTTGNAASWAAPPAATPSPTEPCDSISPYAIPCVALGKTFDALATECRRVGVPDALCLLPLAHKVTQAARDAYQTSWVHQTAEFQSALGDPLPFRDAQWIGTHNSFNSLANGLTLSHADSNQQLTLTQQLDIDVRSIELDLHYIPGILGLLGPKTVTVCHGQGAEVGHLGCTWEKPFTGVLPEVASWLNTPANSNEVILLYLEDNLGDAKAYASAVDTLGKVLKRPDGTSLIYKPDPTQKAANGCVPLSLDTTRDAVRASGARVVLVGKCAPGWSGSVFDWNGVHVEGGKTSAYQAFPACDGTYGQSTYDSQMVRYFEDTTLVSTLLNPSRKPADPEALTPEKVAAMTSCGVNLYGFDQLLPEDGRIQSTLWSWAPDEPRAGAGSCTLQRPDGRWAAAPCTDLHPAACLSGSTWTLTAPVLAADAAAACTGIGSTFDLPRVGDSNSRLHAVAAATGAWVNYSIT
ncbi:hypothetical protein ABIE44_001660 [Marmoricola sp. OAE513]|uniref:hypothetical protein n=1 Tax=Marmoricola sp. OAE513 TaxID=2817894 RepID=UPI001AE2ABE1